MSDVTDETQVEVEVIDRELHAMKIVYEALELLDPDARRRVLAYIIDRFDVDVNDLT